VKGLNEKVEALAAENQILKAEIAALKATRATP
jgi:cell division protein FtsB